MKPDLLELERPYNLVQPDRLVADVRHDQGWAPIAIFEERIRATDDVAGLRVMAATVYLNDRRLNAMHPENDKQYHLAALICAAVNALPELLMRGTGGSR